jgi:hypothetical protein
MLNYTSFPPISWLRSDIIAAATAFLKTGSMHDMLLPFYDQTGRWAAQLEPPEIGAGDSLDALQTTVLPESLRSTINGDGERVLLTSYIHKGEQPHEIPWHEIAGDVRVESETAVTAPNLRRLVPDSGCMFAAPMVYLPELNAASRLYLEANELTIPKLNTVKWAEINTPKLNAPSLQTAGVLELNGTKSAEFPSLRTVEQSISSFSILEFHAQNLEMVNPKSEILSYFLLSAATIIEAPKLKFVGRFCCTRLAPKFWNPDLVVDGEWDMHPIAARLRQEELARRLLRRQDMIEI